MKKVLAILVAVTMLLAMTGCGIVQDPDHWGNDKGKTDGDSILGGISKEDGQGNGSGTVKPDTTTGQGENTEIRPEFKAAMDAYETFYDEYCDIMKKFQENPTDMTILSQYGDLMAKASEVDQAFAKWEAEEMNSAELEYYLEVYNRVMKKMADIMG